MLIPNSEQEYRDVTNKMNMVGVSNITARCSKCGKYTSAEGTKLIPISPVSNKRINNSKNYLEGNLTNIKTIKFPTRMTLTFDAIKCVAMHPEASFQEILERIGRAQNTSRGVINRYLNHHGVTQVDGKWVVPAGLRAHVMRGDKKKLKTDYSTWVDREPYFMPPPLSMRLGANDMRDVKSLKP